MKTLILASLLLAINPAVFSQESKPGQNPKIERENIEWCDMWIHSISKGHPEYYTDAYHYKAEAIELQGKQVADTIKEQLKIK
jgi:hypothetical protein